MDKIKKLPLRDFTKFCMSIAAVPSSYLSGLTMEEQLLWLCSFLTNEVIPTVNNNGEAVEELQALYVELKNYVDNYFDNLDLQEEVNTKLEDMAQSGELAELISQYLESQAVIGFNTNSSLAGATNLANGSFARTYGKDTYNDGKGAFYKIRTRLNSDVPDGDNIIALTNTENLVAEKMPDYRLNQAETKITSLENQMNKVKRGSIICIGDSIGVGWTPSGTVQSWITKLKNKLNYNNTNFYSNAYGGTGFYATGDDKNFLTLLQELNNSISDKDSVTDIIVVGGTNDNAAAITYANITSGIENFVTYAKTTYPNAKIHVGCIAYFGTTGAFSNRLNIINKTLPAYKHIIDLHEDYIYNCEYILHDTQYLASDNVHVKENGQNEISNCIYCNLNGTSYQMPVHDLGEGFNRPPIVSYNLTNNVSYNSGKINVSKKVQNNTTIYGIGGNTIYPNSITTENGRIMLSQMTSIHESSAYNFFNFQMLPFAFSRPIMVTINSNNKYLQIPATLEYNRDYNSTIDSSNNYLYINLYQYYSNITELYVPYQEFAVDTISY